MYETSVIHGACLLSNQLRRTLEKPSSSGLVDVNRQNNSISHALQHCFSSVPFPATLHVMIVSLVTWAEELAFREHVKFLFSRVLLPPASLSEPFACNSSHHIHVACICV